MLVPILRALAPLTAANAYYKSDMLVDRHLLSLAAPGDLSLYSLAHQVFASSSAILGKVWGSNALPSLSRFAANKDRAGFVLLYKRNLIVLAVASIAAALAVAIAAEPVLTLAVLPTRADAGDAQRIALFLVLLSGVLVGGSVGAILAGAFYSLGDTATPTIMSVFTFTVFIVLRVVAFHQAGIEGLCLAVSAYYLTNALLLAVLFPRTLRRRLP
jgi:putative peptidoglycan lipid II flippase